MGEPMSAERKQDLLNRSSKRCEEEVEARKPSPTNELESCGREQRLASTIRRLRHDDAGLLRFLMGVPRVDRLNARVVLIRELGGQRATALCTRAFGPGLAMFPGED